MKRTTTSLLVAVTALVLAATTHAADAVGDIDFDNDGAITELDFEILQAAYLSGSDDENFDPALDLDGDGLISGTDITIFLQLSNS